MERSQGKGRASSFGQLSLRRRPVKGAWAHARPSERNQGGAAAAAKSAFEWCRAAGLPGASAHSRAHGRRESRAKVLPPLRLLPIVTNRISSSTIPGPDKVTYRGF